MDALARRVDRELRAIPGVKLGGRATFYAEGNEVDRDDLVRAELLAFPVLLLLTLIVATLSLGAGRTTVLQGAVRLVIFAVYLFTTVVP